ncbi:response regulator [Pseudoalteromonas umbrosa]|uniref:response regulator n=1 Tax=Pseudoalteromonas umbrosa TaxID=3048489 RepID=UPI0024C28A89|nr:response regulator [Pseudoalteromonas sp. B95]MDK1287426.1 response regulator [Pseudoalteromonas sp. B95]
MNIRKIAIVDDDPNSRKNMKFRVEDSGFEPVIIEGTFGNNKKRLIDTILGLDLYGVVSDHHLSPGKMASFFGAELLADLYDNQIPNILITQFFDQDADTSIRKYRQKLPAVIGRGGSDDYDLIGNLLKMSEKEFKEGPSHERKPHRALIRIDNMQRSIGEGLIEGIITNWNSDVTVKFPTELIPKNVQSQMNRDKVNRLLAFVNTGAVDSRELYISDIHLAPSFEGIDGLD